MKDLTQGNSLEVIVKFALPMILSMVFQQIYNVVDSIVAGQYIGVKALGAVGASQPITVIFIAVAVGTGMGINVVISSFFGAKKYRRVKCAISTSLLTILIVSIVMTGAGLWGCGGMLHMMATPADIFSDSEIYLRIYIAGIIFLMFYNGANAIFTALGDSVTPLVLLIFSSVLNVILDVVFVKYVKMGISGVAWATLIAQGIASVLAVLTLLKKVSTLPTKKYQRFSGIVLKKIVQIAVPSIMQQSFVSVGQLFVQGRINSFGSIVVAGYSAGFKIQIFIISTLGTVGNAISSFVAQNIGAGKFDRMKEGIVIGLKLIVCCGIVSSLVCLIFNQQLMGMFLDFSTKDGLAGLNVGMGFLKIAAPFYVLLTVKFIYDGAMRGMAEMKGFMVSTFIDLIARVALSYALSVPFGYIGIWLSWPIGWILGTAASVVFGKKAQKQYAN